MISWARKFWYVPLGLVVLMVLSAVIFTGGSKNSKISKKVVAYAGTGKVSSLPTLTQPLPTSSSGTALNNSAPGGSIGTFSGTSDGLGCDLNLNNMSSGTPGPTFESLRQTFFATIPASHFKWDSSNTIASSDPSFQNPRLDPGIWEYFLPIPNGQNGAGIYIAYQQHICSFALVVPPGVAVPNWIFLQYSDGSSHPSYPPCWSVTPPELEKSGGKLSISLACSGMG